MCSEKERVQGGITESTACVWAYLNHLREPRGKEHEHYNLLYNSSQNADVLLPPAAASAPSLWRQYFLRWSCPSLANTGGNPPVGWLHGGDLEAASHGLAETFSSVRMVSCLKLSSMCLITLSVNLIKPIVKTVHTHVCSLQGHNQKDLAIVSLCCLSEILLPKIKINR